MQWQYSGLPQPEKNQDLNVSRKGQGHRSLGQRSLFLMTIFSRAKQLMQNTILAVPSKEVIERRTAGKPTEMGIIL